MVGPSSPKEAAQVAVDALKEREIRNYEAIAAIETIRLNQFHIFNLHVEKHVGSDATSQYLYTPRFDPGWIYIITSIFAINNTDGAHQLKVGIKDGATHFVYNSGTIANAGDGLGYVGQLMCKETDQLFGEFRSIGATDDIHLVVNGYKIRR